MYSGDLYWKECSEAYLNNWQCCAQIVRLLYVLCDNF